MCNKAMRWLWPRVAASFFARQLVSIRRRSLVAITLSVTVSGLASPYRHIFLDLARRTPVCDPPRDVPVDFNGNEFRRRSPVQIDPTGALYEGTPGHRTPRLGAPKG
jgi:hypothetical protein